jgi:2-isopropylmalate synthase
MTAARKIDLYDTTLRDGSQGEGVSFTVQDKLVVTEKLDDLGIRYVEGGWPGSNPRDAEYFKAASKLKLKNARVTAFGSTIRPGKTPSQDDNVKALLVADTPAVTIVGKTWAEEVRSSLRISLSANVDLIGKTIAYLSKRVDEVILDAEHFFDGYAANRKYALQCLQAAIDGGANVLCLCDTRGGSLPDDIAAAVTEVRSLGTNIGIHTHDDSGLAIANALAAVKAGAIQVQGTMNGFGERCGNANLCTLLPTLQLKLGYKCVTVRQLKKLGETSRHLYELANMVPNRQAPYVGVSAFTHKGGLHVSAIKRNSSSYEHIEPEIVGNAQRVLVSDLSGRSNIEYKARQFGIDLDNRVDELGDLLAQVKRLEKSGFQFEGADASLELLLRASLNGKEAFFKLIGFRVIDEKRHEDEPAQTEATVMIEDPEGKIEHTAATGNGPVHALDLALRKALVRCYPTLSDVTLHDYKVRVLAGDEGTAGLVRVLIESGDSEKRWGTVGVSHNVVEASWQALVDSLAYKLLKDGLTRARRSRAK